MTKRHWLLLIAIIALISPAPAEAGLFRWLFCRHRCRCNAFNTTYSGGGQPSGGGIPAPGVPVANTESPVSDQPTTSSETALNVNQVRDVVRQEIRNVLEALSRSLRHQSGASLDHTLDDSQDAHLTVAVERRSPSINSSPNAFGTSVEYELNRDRQMDELEETARHFRAILADNSQPQTPDQGIMASITGSDSLP